MVSAPCGFPSSAQPEPVQLDPQVITRLRALLLKRAVAKRLTAQTLAASAAELNLPLSHAYVALSSAPELELELVHEAQIAICTGGCQLAGSLALLERLLQLSHERVQAAAPSFDVLPRQCLSLCAHSPALFSRSQHGVVPHGHMTPDQLEALVERMFADRGPV